MCARLKQHGASDTLLLLSRNVGMSQMGKDRGVQIPMLRSHADAVVL